MLPAVREMETARHAKLSQPSHAGKNDTTFVKDVPKFARYSLADSTERMDGGGMDYHVQTITSDDRPRVLKFLRRFFFRDEPLNQSIGLIPEGEDSTCEELEEYCGASIKDGNLSLMAISTTGAIIGVLLNGKMEPFKDEEPKYITDCENPKFKKILKLLRHVDKSVNRDGRFDGLNVLEFRIVSVDSGWRGQGVAKALMKRAEDIAKESGYHMLRMDCTSLFSGKLAERCGFESIFVMKFCDYLDEKAKPIFSPASPHTSVVSYAKQL